MNQEGDEERLRSIFPTELWMMVFEKALIKDLWNCSKVSKYFEALLRSKRPQFRQLELVLQREDYHTMMSIFPQEVWELVVEKLVETGRLDDLRNMNMASSRFFSHICRRFQLLSLFQDVLLLLANQGSLDRRDFMNIRLVCRSWRDVVNNLSLLE